MGCVLRPPCSFPLFLICSVDLGILCSRSFSQHVKFYSFLFMHEISTRMDCVNGKHLKSFPGRWLDYISILIIVVIISLVAQCSTHSTKTFECLREAGLRKNTTFCVKKMQKWNLFPFKMLVSQISHTNLIFIRIPCENIRLKLIFACVSWLVLTWSRKGSLKLPTNLKRKIINGLERENAIVRTSKQVKEKIWQQTFIIYRQSCWKGVHVGRKK